MRKTSSPISAIFVVLLISLAFSATGCAQDFPAFRADFGASQGASSLILDRRALPIPSAWGAEPSRRTPLAASGWPSSAADEGTLVGFAAGRRQPPRDEAVSSVQPLRLAIPAAGDAIALSPAQSYPARRNWIQRHPVFVGSAIGFTGGFLIGFLPGDDAVFDDFTAGFNGAVIGGIGAGIGGLVGWLASR